eukprot:TRINITY_DN7190_c0_g2_i1.p2 TRINITY_DN7190_c0_g2~~TRINITY_DN7190_c0_g2_i1.p2  ORF type:complete len:606 (-),score=250.62 TRINITY_DN7190_c0_g2_i1:216-2033(-)
MADPCSLSNIEKVKTESFHLELDVDFEKSVLSGSVLLRFRATQDVDEVVLDTRQLNIISVSDSAAALKFELAAEHEAFGSALRVRLAGTQAAGSQFELRVVYATSPSASGLQWLPPSQTEGKQHPYLFSQFQAIHARSGFPCQDSPSVKAAYTARIVVPEPLTALMSAISTGSSPAGPGKTAFTFEQKVPIPSYLVAVVAGHLVSKDIGPRSRVWTESTKLEAAAWEFAETEAFIAAAESFLTPYAFGRYDVLMLPGSFPYGGMENPCLTFVTPTLLAGDRSLADVVAHEIAHSWMGNLVTNANWESFWLNEGFTVYVERKIAGILHGEPMRHFSAIMGHKALADSVALYGPEHNFTSLTPLLKDIDPDDAFSSVPYEKGFQFLFYLERLVGGPNHDQTIFEAFLRAWIAKYQFGTATTGDFIDFFSAYFAGKAPLEQIDWHTWLRKPGMPPVELMAHIDTTLANASHALADSWIAGGQDAKPDDIAGWSSGQKVVFLEKLHSHAAPLPAASLARMDELYQLTKSGNAEVKFRWFMLCIKAGYEAVYLAVVEFLKLQGRMKFVRPLYRDLFRSANGKQLALDTFQQHRDNYHNIASKMIAKDLGL